MIGDHATFTPVLQYTSVPNSSSNGQKSTEQLTNITALMANHVARVAQK